MSRIAAALNRAFPDETFTVPERPPAAERPRPVLNAHADGPEDAHPYRRDYRQFERDRS